MDTHVLKLEGSEPSHVLREGNDDEELSIGRHGSGEHVYFPLPYGTVTENSITYRSFTDILCLGVL